MSAPGVVTTFEQLKRSARFRNVNWIPRTETEWRKLPYMGDLRLKILRDAGLVLISETEARTVRERLLNKLAKLDWKIEFHERHLKAYRIAKENLLKVIV